MPQVGFEYLRQFEVRDDARPIRRYLSHWKFASLIESSTLYFTPASNFSDHLEGQHTHLDDKLSDGELAEWGFNDQMRIAAREARFRVAKINQKAIVISCWTTAINETAQMWSIYGQEPDTVAIESTTGSLRHALDNSFLFIPVTYIDHLRDRIPKDHSLQPFFYKQLSYAWEQEIRLIGEMEMGKRIGSPRLVPIDLRHVVQKVIISPNADPAYRRTVESVLESASLTVPILKSTLNKR